MTHLNFVQPHAPRPQRKFWKGTLIAVLLSIALFVLCGTGLALMVGGTEDSGGAIATPTSTGRDVGKAAGRAATSAPVTPAQTATDKVLLTAGTWEVGSEVRAGTYVTTAQDACYWARLSDFEGNGADSIIANGLIREGARGRFTLKKGDKGLELRGDCVWQRQ